MDTRKLKFLCMLLKEYIDKSNSNVSQKYILVTSDKDGQTQFTTTNGSAICKVNIPVKGPPNIKYSIDSAHFLHVVKAAYVSSKIDIKIDKQCLQITVDNSILSLAKTNPKGFENGLIQPHNAKEIYNGAYNNNYIKSLKHAILANSPELHATTVNIYLGYAYANKYISTCRIEFDIFANKKQEVPIYIDYDDLKGLQYITHGKFSLSKNALIVDHEDGQIIIPRLTIEKDINSKICKAYKNYKAIDKVVVSRRKLLSAARSFSKIIGAADVSITIHDDHIEFTTVDTNQYQTFVPCKSNIHVHAITKMSLIVEGISAMNDDEIEVVIPDLAKPHKALMIKDSKCANLIALRPDGLLRRCKK